MNAASNLPALGQAEQILDFSKELEVPLLEKTVGAVYAPVTAQEQAAANEILMRFKALPDAWTRVDRILEFAVSPQTKYFALSILEETIKVRWKSLPPDQREAIKGYIVQLVIRHSTDAGSMSQEKLYLQKMNQILVQILKQEWPENWQSFIPDIVAASRTNETLCQNNMVILKLLSEEVFDFSTGQMTHRKARKLKDTMCNQFNEVFSLCMFVTDCATSADLMHATLETLLRFLGWIPLGYMFETDLIPKLIKFMYIPEFRNVALQCLTEIASTKLEKGQYSEQLVMLYVQALSTLKQMLPLEANMPSAYKSGSPGDQEFVRFLSLFFTSFFKEHGRLLEGDSEMSALLIDGHHYLVMISDVDETEIFKICLEYWVFLLESLYNESPYTVSTMHAGLLLGAGAATSPRRKLYAPVLRKLRHVMISHMVKPEEVLIVESENGEIVREFMPTHTDNLNQYRTMRQALVFLTHLDFIDTKNIMTERLHEQTEERNWSWKGLNTLCWAIGSISGAMGEEEEKQFLVTIIKYLLMLVEMKRGKDNKAVVAANIMYIVGQYPRFLRAHWKFLKTVVNKLFEFMHETHEGVQDMACDTFIKIAQKCRKHFVQTHPGEEGPFIDEILRDMNSIICDLTPQQIHTFYEAVGYMVQAQGDSTVKERLIEQLMALPNSSWDQHILMVGQNVNSFVQDPERMKQVINVLKTNLAVCKSVGHSFMSQLGRIYMDLLGLYRCVSELIIQYINIQGPDVLKTQQLKYMRGIRKETLKLIDSWLARSIEPDFVMANFVAPLMGTVLDDYQISIPQAREPEVLALLATLIGQMKGRITNHLPNILSKVFEPTLEMINKDLSEYPDHRTNFFKMLEATVNGESFEALFHVSDQTFRLVMESIYWAMKHTMRNVAETGLTILKDMMKNIVGHAAAPVFYQTYVLTTTEHIFAVLADSAYQSGFKQLCDLLALIVAYIEEDVIQTTLSPNQPAGVTNSLYARQFLSDLLQRGFPNLQGSQADTMVERIFLEYKNPDAFKVALQDLLVQIKAIGEDEAEIQEERAQLEQAKAERQRAVMQVPGMVNPYQNEVPWPSEG